MPVFLPSEPTVEDLEQIEDYLNFHKKLKSDNDGLYQSREELRGSKLIIFKHKHKGNNWYYRMYLGGGSRKYKIASLKTPNVRQAREEAHNEYERLTKHLLEKGDVFEKTNEEYLQDYLKYLEKELEKKNEITSIRTVNAKKTSLKKLKTLLKPYKRPSDIPADFLKDYILWRRKAVVEGGNWQKHHKKNTLPPTDQTMYKEVSDMKGFFNYLKAENVTHKEIQFPQIKLDLKRLKTKNVPYTDEDWRTIYQWMPVWIKKKYTLKGEKMRRDLEKLQVPEEVIVRKIGLCKKGKKSKFYKKMFYNLFLIAGNSGLRQSSLLQLKWRDIQYKKGKRTINPDGTITNPEIAIISVSVDSKTGFRKVPTPTGKWFRNLSDLYKEETGEVREPDQYIFRNIGTDNSKGDKFVGNPLSQSFILRMFYEMIEELKFYKGIGFNQHYSLHSNRSFYINKKLELGIPIAVVAQASGNNVQTIIKHYENLRVEDFTDELVKQKRMKLSKNGFETMDIDDYYTVEQEI